MSDVTWNEFHITAEQGNRRDFFHIIKKKTVNLYEKACDEFGVFPAPLDVFMVYSFPGYFGQCSTEKLKYPFGKVVIANHTIRFHYGWCRKFPYKTFLTTIPHEVAHAVAEILFPEIEQIGHGKEWQEVMKYFKLIPDQYESISEESFSAVKEYQDAL